MLSTLLPSLEMQQDLNSDEAAGPNSLCRESGRPAEGFWRSPITSIGSKPS